MPNASEPQIVKLSLAPVVESEVTIPISVLPESVDCKIAQPGDVPGLSKMNKPGKTEKKRSLKPRDNRARPHLIDILMYLVFASTTLMGLNIGYEGSLRFLGRRIEETKANISASEDRNAVELMVRSKLDTLTHGHLPLRFLETHEDCLVRGAYAAYSRALPGDYTDFPEIRNQTLAWIADSCEKIFTPQAQQLTPKTQLAIIWHHWRQEAENLLQIMKYKLGNARGWLRLKLGRTHPTQHLAPLNTTEHNAVDHETKSTKVLEPISIYIRCQTSRCHLFYIPLVKHLLESSVVQQESLSIVERRLNILQETHTKFKRTSFWLTLVTMGMIFLEESLILALCKIEADQPKKRPSRLDSWKIFSELRRSWEEADVMDKRLIGAFAMQISCMALHGTLLWLGDSCPVVVYAGHLVLAYTGVHALVVLYCVRYLNALTLRQLSVDLRTLAFLRLNAFRESPPVSWLLEHLQKSPRLKRQDGSRNDKDSANPAPMSIITNDPIPNVRIISPTTTFIEDLEEEVRLHHAFPISTPALTLSNGLAPESTELLLDDVRYQPTVYEDVDLHSASDSDSSWSLI
jgi:hypothetical protein